MSIVSNDLMQSILKILPKDIAQNQFCAFRYNLFPDSSESHCEGIVTVDGEHLHVLCDGKETDRVACAEIEEIITDMGVGCIFVSCRYKSGIVKLICRSDLAYSKSIIKNIRSMNSFFEDKRRPEGEAEREYKCPKCHRPYINGSSVCPHCADKKQLFKRVWKLFAPYKVFVFSAVALFAVVSAVNLIVPYINRVIVDSYIQKPDYALQNLSSYAAIMLSMLVLELVIRGVSSVRYHLFIKASNSMIVDLRDSLFSKIQRLSVNKISAKTTGDLMRRVTSDTSQMENFLINYMPGVIEQLTVFVAVSIYILIYDARLFVMIIIPTPFVVLSFNLFWKFIRNMYHRRWIAGAKANTVLHDIFSGIRVVKAFGMEHKEGERYREATADERRMQEKSDCIWSLIMPILRFFIGFGEFIILFYVGNKILDGSMTLGQMTQFASYTSMIYGPLRMIAHIPRHVMNFITSASKVFEILDESEEISDSETSVELNIKGDIDIKNVSFGYDGGLEVLHKVSVHIKPGEFLGIVGASGAGKSTLINLIMRMYDVEDGSISVDGVDIRNISQNSLRSQMGVVLQETFLFSGTVYQNIAYAKPDATRDEVIAVSKLAGCHEFIIKLPDGYNTKVGEKGYTVSGGERQRIAIARALLHNPKILILDEATASLDTETEKQIQDALARLSFSRTTIAIAHRLSTLRNANRLIVLDKGRVAEEGTHSELMQKRGIYYGLVMAQREMSNMEEI